MPNSLVDKYRQIMADQGTPDTRDDVLVMRDLIPLAETAPGQLNPDIEVQYPDFAQEYGEYRSAGKSFTGEFGTGFKAGTEETGATYAGIGGLLGVPGATEEAKKLEGEAAENAPTVATLSDIAPGETGLSKVFSKDTVRYLTAKAGGIIPSMAEMVGLALGGAAVGSAIEPGVGTAAGAAEGALEEALGTGIVKKAIKDLIEKQVIKDTTEEGVADLVRAGNKRVIDDVTQQAKAIAAGRAEAGVNLANVYGMTAGGIYNETGDRGEALGLAAPAALLAAPPFISLPARVAKTLFPKLTAAAAESAASDLVGKKTAELLAKLGRAGSAAAVGTGGVMAMEASNIVAKNLSAGKDPLDLDDADWKRLREATIGGLLGSAPFAALAARSPTVEAAAGGPPPAPEPGEPAPEPAPPVPEVRMPTALDVTRRVAQMDQEEQRARLADLQASPQRNESEEIEFQQLKALAPGPEAPAGPPIAAPETPGVPPAVNAPFEPPEPAEEPPASPRTTTAPTLEEAGFKSQEQFDAAYMEGHDREVFETKEEMLKRLYCQARAA